MAQVMRGGLGVRKGQGKGRTLGRRPWPLVDTWTTRGTGRNCPTADHRGLRPKPHLDPNVIFQSALGQR